MGAVRWIIGGACTLVAFGWLAAFLIALWRDDDRLSRLALLVLRAISASGVIPYAEFHVNYRILLYGIALTLFFGSFSGVYPAWRMSRLNPVQALKGAAR